MKELTIEEKAQVYDRVLEIAKKWRNAPNVDKIPTFANRVIEELFPELQESKDERIRKALIDGFTVMKESKNCSKTFSNHNIPVADILAWLEKQDYNYTFEIKGGHWYKCVCDYMLNGSDLMFKNDRLYYCRRDWRLEGEIDERNVKDIGVNGYTSFFRPATNQEIKDWLEKQGEQKIDDDDKAILENWEGIVKDNKEKWQLSDWFVEATLLLVQKINQIGLSKSIIDNNKTMLNACINTLRNVGHSHLAAWLKKQSEQKPQGKSAFEAIKEEMVDNQNYIKSAEKVEQKFHKGEWIVKNDGNECFSDGSSVVQVVEVNNGNYRLSNGNSLKEPFVDTYRLWNISDAKDGDVLHSTGFHNDCIFIFNGLDNWKFDEPNGDRAVATGYCCLFVSADNMEFGIQGPDCVEVNTIKPATNIQRDLLFQKMREAGYKWDAEEKELKKIEQQSVEWGEEDDKMVNKICTDIEQTKKLIELGIDINTADLTVIDLPIQNGDRFKYISSKLPNDTFPSITDGKSEKVPVWSLSALLELMPTDDKKDEYYVDTESHSDYHTVSYRNCWDGCVHSEYSKKSLLDAAFEMVCWLKKYEKI